MPLPIYRGDHPASRHKDANRGLWYTRFYKAFNADWETDVNSKRSWITENAGACGNDRELKAHVERMKRLNDALGGHCGDFDTVWHFATGLGISHPVENGFAWHHTLGVPFLAASGVKGLLRGWTECWRDFDNEEARQATITRCFGASAGDAYSSAGNLIFFDALPIEQVHLAADVMTPHMGKWYEQGHDIHGPQDYATKIPADWYSPVPVSFLVVKKAAFRFMIAPRLIGDEAADTQARVDALDAIQQLEQALEWLGAGAKTAAGYGRMARRKTLEETAVAWFGARIKFNRSTGVLSVEKGGNSATASAPKGKELLDTLPPELRKKVEGNQFVKVTAYVAKYVLVRIEAG